MRDQIVLLDDFATVTRTLRAYIERLSKGRLIRIFEFNDDISASRHIIDNKDRIFALIQDLHRDNATGYDHGSSFYEKIFLQYTPEARMLVYSGNLDSDSILRLIRAGEGNGDIRFLSKADTDFNRIDEYITWLIEAYDASRIEAESQSRVALIRAVELPWQEMCRSVASDPTLLGRMDSRVFERLVAGYFESHGWSVELTGRTRDGGHDIIAIRQNDPTNLRLLIEAKRWSPARPVGVDVVRALYAVRSIRAASQVVLATTSYVSPDAKREFSRVTPWELDFLERDRILEWCERWRPGINIQSTD